MLSITLDGAFRAHDGLLDLEALALHGLDRRDVRRAVSAGDLTRVRVGVYMPREQWERTDSWIERQVLQARAAAMTMYDSFAFSHDSAAHLQGLSFLRPPVPLVHTTQARYLGGYRLRSGVKHHGAPYLGTQVRQTRYGAVLDLARTACDLVRAHGQRIGLSACDSALRRGVTPEEFADAVGAMTYWRHVKLVRDTIGWADPGADNPGESLARLMVIGLGLGRPLTQFPVPRGSSIAWTDLLLGAHAFEFDGRLKYRRVEAGGSATSDPGNVVWQEREREQDLIRQGLAVSRMTWDDLSERRWNETRERLTREVTEARERLGHTTPPHLLAFAERLAPQRAQRLRAS